MMTFTLQAVRAQTDSLLYRDIDEVSIEAGYSRQSANVRLGGRIDWSAELLEDLPKVLGTADPMHYMQYLPGVQTTAGFSGGLYVNGCSLSHNLISLDGVPVYNPLHLFGMYSVFNVDHYSGMSLQKSVPVSSLPRIGAVMDASTASEVETISLKGSLGMMSSQGTLKLPLGEKAGLILSGRSSYLSLLYGDLLNSQLPGIRWDYRFWDLNGTFVYSPNEHNRLSLNAYSGQDKLHLDQTDNQSATDIAWGNRLYSLEWNHRFQRGWLEQQLYGTSYANRLNICVTNSNLALPSDIGDWGYRLERMLPMGENVLRYGANLVRHDIQPQDPRVDGSRGIAYQSQPSTRSYETTLFGRWSSPLGEDLVLAAALRGNGYFADEMGKKSRYLTLDPQVELFWDRGEGRQWALQAGLYHQFLHQAGFTNGGLPTEFWFSASDSLPPQSALSLSVGYEMPLWDGSWALSSEVYGHLLRNQYEYVSNIYDILQSSYSLNSSLHIGHGYAAGINLMLQKKDGPLTGWVSYSFSRSRLRFANGPYFPAYYERPHDLNAVVYWRPGGKWSFSASGVLASGTPYTAPLYAYILNGVIVCKYGDHNSARLPVYHRLDLSADWIFHERGRHQSGLNFSLYNAAFSRNVLYYSIHTDEKGNYHLHYPMVLIPICIPSVSLFFKI